MHNLGIALNGKPCTLKEIRHAFFNAGYGPRKTDKWITLYSQEGILYDIGQRDESGALLFDCEWFYKPEWVEQWKNA